jgi:chromosome segregation ATPase
VKQTLSERISAVLDKLEETREILCDLVGEAENLEYDLGTERMTVEDQAGEIEGLEAEIRELQENHG